MRRRILVISRNESVGRRFRFLLGGLRVGLPTTVVTDLEEGLRLLRRWQPRVVIFADEGGDHVDDRLMLLRALLLIEQEGLRNTLAILYNLTDGRVTMYHSAHLQRVGLEDVARLAADTVTCPIFGCDEPSKPAFPQDCRFLPIMVKGTA
jgi:hypothetical protein